MKSSPELGFSELWRTRGSFCRLCYCLGKLHTHRFFANNSLSPVIKHMAFIAKQADFARNDSVTWQKVQEKHSKLLPPLRRMSADGKDEDGTASGVSSAAAAAAAGSTGSTGSVARGDGLTVSGGRARPNSTFEESEETGEEYSKTKLDDLFAVANGRVKETEAVLFFQGRQETKDSSAPQT